MALRGTLTHRKTRRLARALNIPACYALGILEALWHMTAEQHPDGDLSSLSSRDIADEIFYEDNPEGLVAALVDAGWLDQKPGTLTIHDWADHADQSVRRKLERRGQAITSHEKTVTSHDSLACARGPVPVPEPVPEPVPVPVPDTPLPPKGDSSRKRFAKPTTSECEDYAEQIGLTRSEGVAFWDFWEGVGWKRKQGAMADWRASLRTWKRNAALRAPLNGRAGRDALSVRRSVGEALGCPVEEDAE